MRNVAIGILFVYVQDSNNKWDAVHVMTSVMLLMDFNSPTIRHTCNRLAPPGQTGRCGSLIFSAKSAGLCTLEFVPHVKRWCNVIKQSTDRQQIYRMYQMHQQLTENTHPREARAAAIDDDRGARSGRTRGMSSGRSAWLKAAAGSGAGGSSGGPEPRPGAGKSSRASPSSSSSNSVSEDSLPLSRSHMDTSLLSLPFDPSSSLSSSSSSGLAHASSGRCATSS